VLVLLWRALRVPRWGDLGRLIATADGGWVVAGVALLLARYLIWTLRWRLALRCLGALPHILHSFFTVVGAVCANGFTPTAPVVGGLLRARHAAGEGNRTFGRVYGVVLFDQLAHQAVISLTGALAAVGVALWLGRVGVAVALAAALATAIVAFSRWLDRLDQERVERIADWLERWRGREQGTLAAIHEHAREALRVAQRLLRERWLRRAALALGIAYVLVNALALWAFFRSLGRPVDLLTAWVAVTVGVAVGGFTGTPGGVGTTEAGLALALVAMDVPQLEAAAATLLYRGLHYVVVLAVGAPALVLLEARLRRRAMAEEAA
jgi:uncharacterized protein (TIRG00374 family)